MARGKVSGSFSWKGLKEFRAMLVKLPDALLDQGKPIMRASAARAKTRMYDRYPKITGKLASGLTLTEKGSGHAFGVRLTNRTFYAHMFEYGTKYAAPGRVFIPIRDQEQRAMYDELRALLVAHGFKVSGSMEGVD